MPLTELKVDTTDSPILGLLRYILLWNTFQYHSMELYRTSAQQSVLLCDEILAIVHEANLAARVIDFEASTVATFKLRRDMSHLNVVLLPTAESWHQIDSIDKNFLSHDDHMFVIQFTQVSDEFIQTQVFPNVGLYRAILFHRQQAITLNRFDDYSIERIDTTYAWTNVERIAQFANDYVLENDGSFGMNLHGFELTVFMKVLPYLTIMVRDGEGDGVEDASIIGPDGFVAQQLVHQMNGTAMVVCDVLLESPKYKRWYRQFEYLRRGEKGIWNHPRLLTDNIVRSIQWSAKDPFDLHMTAIFLHEPHHGHAELDHSYPHRRSCVRVIVPKNPIMTTLLYKMANHRTVQLVVVVVMGFAFVRPLTVGAPLRGWFAEWLNTVGIYFAQLDVTVQRGRMRRTELFWLIGLLPFSVVGLAAFSASFYTLMVAHVSKSELDTVEDLIESNLTVFAPNYIDHNTWNVELLAQLRFKTIGEIDEMVMFNVDTTYAYAMESTRVDYLIRLHTHLFQPSRYHVMRDSLCECRSMVVWFAWRSEYPNSSASDSIRQIVARPPIGCRSIRRCCGTSTTL